LGALLKKLINDEKYSFLNFHFFILEIKENKNEK